MKNVIITILAVLVLGLGGFIIYDKVINKDNDPTNKNQLEEKNNGNEQTNESIYNLKVDKNNFKNLRIYMVEEENGYPQRYYDEVALIDNYDYVENLISKLKNQKYVATNTSGFGYNINEIQIEYYDNNSVKEVRILGNELLLFENKAYRVEEKNNTEILNLTESLYNTYKNKSYVSKLTNKSYLVDVDTIKYKSIFQYLKDQKNVIMTFENCIRDENANYTKNNVKLTSREINNILSELSNSKEDIADGGIGGVCLNTLKIEYERNGKTYKISVYPSDSNFIVSAKNIDDGNIHKIFDENYTGKYSTDSENYMFKGTSETLKEKISNS